MTDDETTPLGGPPPASDSDDSSQSGKTEQPDPDGRRRRRLIRFGVAGAAVLILLFCVAAGAVAAGVTRLARHADEADDNRSRIDAGCLDLERRLNRLAPPGAAKNPAQRATAIRAENVALGPFLSELDGGQRHVRRADGPDRDRRDPDDPSPTIAWHQLVDARTAFADALDGQAAGRGPAFFAAPKDRRGRPLFDRLDDWPRSCDGVIRRLTAPDL